MSNKVIGPLSVRQFMVLMLSSATVYVTYLVYGYNYILWIVIGLLAVGNLLYLKFGE